MVFDTGLDARNGLECLLGMGLIAGWASHAVDAHEVRPAEATSGAFTPTMWGRDREFEAEGNRRELPVSGRGLQGGAVLATGMGYRLAARDDGKVNGAGFGAVGAG